MQGVVGCVRNFRMNGSAMAAPAVNRGVGQCFEGQMESGAYFSGQGAHVIIGESCSNSFIADTSFRKLFCDTGFSSCLCADESFVVNQKFELVFEMRPSNQSGLLLHVGNSDHHLTVFMRKGEVSAFFKFGPQSRCYGLKIGSV